MTPWQKPRSHLSWYLQFSKQAVQPVPASEGGTQAVQLPRAARYQHTRGRSCSPSPPHPTPRQGGSSPARALSLPRGASCSPRVCQPRPRISYPKFAATLQLVNGNLHATKPKNLLGISTLLSHSLNNRFQLAKII